jgi:hypothetical protein
VQLPPFSGIQWGHDLLAELALERLPLLDVAAAGRGEFDGMAVTGFISTRLVSPLPGASSTQRVSGPGYDLAKSMIGTWASFIFAVDDINATYQELTARRVEFQDAPSRQDWGWWATINDPDGTIIGLHSS